MTTRIRKFVASWLHIFRAQEYAKTPNLWTRLMTTARLWRLYGYGRDFHLDTGPKADIRPNHAEQEGPDGA